MLKSIFVKSFSLVLCSVFLVSNSLAAIHPEIPTEDFGPQEIYIGYLQKEARCLDAFVRSDFEVARAICIPLANRGFSEAQLVTGLMYAFGKAVEKDMRVAKIWLTEAKNNGHEGAVAALVEFGLE